MALKFTSEVTKEKGVIKHANISRLSVRPGKEPKPSPVLGLFNAEVNPKAGTLRVFGNHDNGRNTKDFDRAFKTGDQVIYDSYNLIYTGEITAIGPQTVTVDKGDGGVTKLRLDEFIERNWDLDLAAVSDQNYSTSLHI